LFWKGETTLEITYKVNAPVTVEQALCIYERAGLNRPKEPHRVQNMLRHANLLLTAWDGDELVGFLRALTDYSFDCYLNDLAVDKRCQKQGIGRKLVELLHEQIEEETMILLVAAPDAVDFYARLGFKNFKRLEDSWYVVKR
jgi:ribosomal protein S18 acetylase RimI-like enzyme